MKQKGFLRTRVQISTNGQRHLGVAIGTQGFIEAYVSRKVLKLVNEIETKLVHILTSLCILCPWRHWKVAIPDDIKWRIYSSSCILCLWHHWKVAIRDENH